MTVSPPDRQIDLFAPFLAGDLPLRDQRDLMERPFFGLSKRKRLKPIDYASPDGSIFVRVTANPEFGMAQIWDADILIWAASTIQQFRTHRVNDVPRTLRFLPYDLLKSIHRGTGGADYHRLRDALGRLQSTTIETNIRARRANTHRQFSWIESWSDDVDPRRGVSRGMTLTVSDWFYEGVVMEGGLLAINPRYFDITGGRERWLYRVARKHAGGHGETGFPISFTTLFEKSGAEGSFKRFKFELLKIAARNPLPDYSLLVEQLDRSDPLLRMTRRDGAPAARLTQPSSELDPRTLDRLRRDFPGTDIASVRRDFDRWLANSGKNAYDYPAAFYGFIKRVTS